MWQQLHTDAAQQGVWYKSSVNWMLPQMKSHQELSLDACKQSVGWKSQVKRIFYHKF